MSEVIGSDEELNSSGHKVCNWVLVSWNDAHGNPLRIGWVKVSDKLLAVPVEAVGPSTQTESKNSEIIPRSRTLRDGEIKHGEVSSWVEDDKTICDYHAEPMFGLEAVLDDANFDAISSRTKPWFVETVSFVELAFITRAELLELLKEHWPQASTIEENSERVDADVSNSLARAGSCRKETLHASTQDMTGGQRALGRLVLMDHGMEDVIGSACCNSSSSSRRKPAVETVSATATAHQGRAQSRTVQSFDDCSHRFDAIESQLTDVMAMQQQIFHAVSSLQKT